MHRQVEAILNEIEKVMIGKTEVLEKVIMTILANGHILLDDVPGVGKTTMAIAVSRALGVRYNRIQFTPDVMPSDIVGFSIYNKQTGGFEYMPGIVTNTNILLGDEINRTSSKTQSALLEAMEEEQVTVDGKAHAMRKPFIVIATQNRVGTAGTQMLPYAQIDRFMVRLSIGYPDYESQIAIIRDRQTQNPMKCVMQAASCDDVLNMQCEVSNVTMKDEILSYITELAMATRAHPMIDLGISPRGAIYLSKMARAKAYVTGRDYVIPEDVRDVFEDVGAHRILLSAKAMGQPAGGILRDVLQEVKLPNSL